MAKCGCQPGFIAMVRQFHDDIQARAKNDGEFSEPFEETVWLCYANNTVQHDVFCHHQGWFFRTVTLVFQSVSILIALYEPPRGKTNNVVSEQFRHKSGCTVTEKS